MLKLTLHNFIYSGWAMSRPVTCKGVVHLRRPRGREANRD
jgi:hypothetical protein